MDGQRLASRGMAIPRRVKYLSESELPHELSSTPGGTLYSTTPGGSRIIYERNMLLQMRNSPVASTPPRNLQHIPGVTKDTVPIKNPVSPSKDENSNLVAKRTELEKQIPEEEDTEFTMEI